MLNKKEENTQIVKDNSKKKLFYEILRFILVGGLATIADYAIFYLFRQLILPSSLIESNSWNTKDIDKSQLTTSPTIKPNAVAIINDQISQELLSISEDGKINCLNK